MTSPTFGRALLTTLVTARSAYCGVNVSVSVLFKGSGSYSRPETVAVFVTAGGMPAGDGALTVTTIRRVGKSFVVTVPIVHTPVPGTYVEPVGAFWIV